eukprot:446797_1
MSTCEQSYNEERVVSAYVTISTIDMKLIFPLSIVPIIVQYFMDNFEWDINLQTNNCHVQHDDENEPKAILTFTNNNMTVESSKFETNYYCPSTNIISKHIHSLVKWQIRIDKMLPMNNYQPANYDILCCIGYVKYPCPIVENSRDSTWNYWLGNSPYQSQQFCLQMDSIYTANSWSHNGGELNNQIVDLKNTSSGNVKVGDTISIHFDFNKMESLVFYNSKFIGVLYKNIPSKLIPAIVIANSHKITTTKWELMFKK